MCTSAIRKLSKWRVPLGWLLASLGCVAITNIYALFGHGVRSDAMDWMFLYPLLAGFLPYGLLRPTSGGKSTRLARNLYDSGIATLTAGAMLRGILEIAGTASPYTVIFTVTGWIMLAAGAALRLPSLIIKGEISHGHRSI